MDKPEIWEEASYYWNCPLCGQVNDADDEFESYLVCVKCDYVYDGDIAMHKGSSDFTCPKCKRQTACLIDGTEGSMCWDCWEGEIENEIDKGNDKEAV